MLKKITYIAIILIMIFSSFSSVIETVQATDSEEIKLSVATTSGVLNEAIDVQLTDTTKREKLLTVTLPEGLDFVKSNVKAVNYDVKTRVITLNESEKEATITLKPTVVGQVKLIAETNINQQATYSNELVITVVEREQSAIETSVAAAESVAQSVPESTTTLTTTAQANVTTDREEHQSSEQRTSSVTTQTEKVSEARETSETTPEKASRKRALAGTEANASTWAEFKAAWQDGTISKINLMNDIKADSDIKFAIRSLELNGNGYKLELSTAGQRLNIRQTTGYYDFHMHDIIVSASGVYESAYLDAGYSTAEAGRWNFRLGNISTAGDMVNRLVVASAAETIWYGENTINTQAENMYAGSIIFEPNTHYHGNVTENNNVSNFYFNIAPTTSSTGRSKEFTVGANAVIQLGQTTTNKTYPAIYDKYGTITIGENATFTTLMGGTAIRMDNANSKVVVKKGAVIHLHSSLDAPVIYASMNSNSFTAEAGSSIFIVGQYSSGGVVRMFSTTTFAMINPSMFDIRNLSKASTAKAVELSATGTFNLQNSDIDLWKVADLNLGSDKFAEQVTAFNVYGINGAATSTTTSLVGTVLTDYQRIAGINQTPTIEWPDTIAGKRVNTDADKTIKARVKIGEVPNNEAPTAAGIISYVPVYASVNQASVAFTDEAGKTYTGTSDKDGYAHYTVAEFYKKGTVISGLPTRGPYTGEVGSTTISDLTPPLPAELDQAINVVSRSISGSKAEIGATVRITIDGEAVAANATVGDDGKWQLNLPEEINFPVDSEVQIFLKDTAGNENPATDKVVNDATFPAATKVKTLNAFPQSTLKQTVTNLTSNAPPVESTPTDPTLAIVGDRLSYTLTVGNVGSLEWSQVLVEDTIPNGMTVTKVTLDGAEQTLNIDPNNVSLTIPIIAVNEEHVIAIETIVTKEALGLMLLNKAVVAKDDTSLAKVANTIVKVADKPTIENTQTVTNLTNTAGTFNVGDTVKYQLKTTNTADRGTVSKATINNAIPKGLLVDETSIKLTDVTGNETPVSATSLSADNELSVNQGTLAAGETAIVTFEAEIQPVLSETIVENIVSTVATYLSVDDVVSEAVSVRYTVEKYTGALSLVAVPDNLSFGSDLAIQPVDKSYGLSAKTGDLIVSDTRINRSQWTLDARMSQQLSANGIELTDAIAFKPLSGNPKVLNASFNALYSATNTTDINNLSNNWSTDGEGFYLNVKAGVGLPGTYQGTIEWVLKDTPA